MLHSVLVFDALAAHVRFDGLSSLALVRELGTVCGFEELFLGFVVSRSRRNTNDRDDPLYLLIRVLICIRVMNLSHSSSRCTMHLLDSLLSWCAATET